MKCNATQPAFASVKTAIAAVLIPALCAAAPVPPAHAASADNAYPAYDLNAIVANISPSTGLPYNQNVFPDTSAPYAWILGPTGKPQPSDSDVAWFLTHYLDHDYSSSPGVPEGSDWVAQVGAFIGNAYSFWSPETFSSDSYLQGDAEVVHHLLQAWTNGDLSADDPLTLFGYSQSATILTAVDSHLGDEDWLKYVLEHGGYAGDLQTYADQLTHMQDIAPMLRLVLVGDPAAAPDPSAVGNGFASTGFDNAGFTQFWLNSGLMGYGGGTVDGSWAATISSLGPDRILGTADDVLTNGYSMAGQNTNLDLSPTVVYTVQGDNWAQAMNFFGLPVYSSSEHIIYGGLDASQFDYVTTVGNVDYFEAGPGDYNIWDALWQSAMTALGWG